MSVYFSHFFVKTSPIFQFQLLYLFSYVGKDLATSSEAFQMVFEFVVSTNYHLLWTYLIEENVLVYDKCWNHTDDSVVTFSIIFYKRITLQLFIN
jgi:hypothetical protein